MSNFLKGIFGKDEANLAIQNGALESAMDPAASSDNGQALQSYAGDGPIEYTDQAVDLLSSEELTSVDIGDTDPRSSSERPRVFDIAAVWKARNVTEQQQERVFKAQRMLSALPAGIPDIAKRQIVEASLKAFEVSIDEIVSGASHEVEALESFIASTNLEAEGFAAQGKAQIERLEAEIENIRQTMEDEELDKSRLVAAANEVIEQVTPILDFFGPPNVSKTDTNKMAAGGAARNKSAGASEPTAGKNEAAAEEIMDEAATSPGKGIDSSGGPKLPPFPRN